MTLQTTFWKIYYRITLKENFNKSLKSARSIGDILFESTDGKFNHFYDKNGDKIRGWHKQIRINEDLVNPLIKKYS